MIDWLSILVGFLIGATITWLIARARTSTVEARAEEVREQLKAAKEDFDKLREALRQAEIARAEAETRAIDTEKNLAEQKFLLEDARARLSDTFKSLAAEALASNNQGFLMLAEEKFATLRKDSASELEGRHKSIESLVQPLSEALTSYQRESKELEEKRLRELSIVGEQLRSLATAQLTLQTETAKLVNALRSPQVRGRWGEIALRKTAELAGMSPHCDFVEQASITTDTGRLRPDMVVKLPASREVVVDSKVPLGGFLEALEAKNDDERELALSKHVSQVNQHVIKLSSKEYWDQFSSTPEFVVLFIPNDSFLAAAAERDPSLVESALTKKVVIATPATFIALLRAIAYGWRQEQLAENAQRISSLGQELSDRIATFAEHLNRVGGSLGKSVDSFNAVVSSLESRILPTARKFKTLGAGGKKEIEELQPVDQKPRPLSIPEITKESPEELP